ncbi:MAG: hypothetical protein U5K30_01515 [Acidimicrobiales bacterium]|nr:hypothetical protein [Acidimicrobiales bacterium]
MFEENRLDLADTLGSSTTDVETADRLVFENGTVVIEVTSTWASPDNQHDGAWTLTKALSQFWEPDGIWYQDAFDTAFQLVNSGRTYTCAGEFMVQTGQPRGRPW